MDVGEIIISELGSGRGEGCGVSDRSPMCKLSVY